MFKILLLDSFLLSKLIKLSNVNQKSESLL